MRTDLHPNLSDVLYWIAWLYNIMASLYIDFEEGIFAWISTNFPSGPNVFFVRVTLNASIFIGGDAIEYTR